MEEEECDSSLPFLNVLVERKDDSFITSVYRKRIFTGLYTRNSFVPKSRKLNLIFTLAHRVLICSCKLDCEMENIDSIFRDNTCLENVIKRTIESRVKSFKSLTMFGPGLCPVYLKLPWLERCS